MHLGTLLTITIIYWFWMTTTTTSLQLPFKNKDFNRNIEVVKNNIDEPSCEELKAMWRYSKRQSRAAEITNKIPIYKDPFANNVWEPFYPTSRSIAGMRMGRYRSRPIYGRLVHRPSMFRIQDSNEKNRAFEEVAKIYGNPKLPSEPARRKFTAFRLSGGSHLSPAILPQVGSFQHLKELIRSERAKELQQQKISEENIANVFNDLSNEQNYSDVIEDNDTDILGRIAFPNLLAPAASHPNIPTSNMESLSHVFSRNKRHTTTFN